MGYTRDVETALIFCFTQCLFRVNPIYWISARFENIIYFTRLPIHFQLNLNTNTERVNSLNAHRHLLGYESWLVWLNVYVFRPVSDVLLRNIMFGKYLFSI